MDYRDETEDAQNTCLWVSQSIVGRISYQHGGKGWLAILDEIEQTVSEYASQRIDMRAVTPSFWHDWS